METAVDRRSRGAGQWLKMAARALLLVIETVVAIAIVGTVIPRLPISGALGLVTTSIWPWLALVATAFALLEGVRWRRRGGSAVTMAAIMAVAAIVATGVTATQAIAARHHGVVLDIPRIFMGDGARHASSPPDAVVYARDGSTPLHLLIYPPAPAATARPILVYVHGGGWVSGSQQGRAEDLRWFADRGFLVVSVEYSLSSERRHLWKSVPGQIGCALSWVARNAARLGGDAGRIATFGDSAGGQLVLTSSYRANSGRLPSMCGGEVPSIRASIASNPAVDLAAIYGNADPILGKWARSMLTRYLGGSPREFPARYAASSPINSVGSNAPPTLLIVGDIDQLVQGQGTIALAGAVRRAGVAVQLIAFPYGAHTFDAVPGGIGSQLVREAALRFLQDHKLRP